jgi:hemolysin activation/secretion protein
VFAVFATNAQAQEIPSSVQPGSVERELNNQPPPPPSGDVSIPAPTSFEAPANASAVHIHLTAVDVVGATAFPAAELAPAYEHLIARDATVADLYKAANEITAKYVAAGYAISFAIVPKQTIENGRAEIDVVEGYVAEFRFEGDTGRMPSVLNGYAEKIVSSRPLRVAALERFLLLANDIPGYTVKSVFERIEGAPRGATRLVIHLEYKALAVSVSGSNRGSKAFGPYRGEANATANNLFGHGDELHLRGLISSDTKELRYGSADMSVPLDSDGTRLVIEGTYSDAHPGLGLLELIQFVTNGTTARIGVEHPLIRSRKENLLLDVYATGQWLDSKIFSFTNSTDRLYLLSPGATYWRYDNKGMTTLSLRITQGLDIFDATTSSSPRRSRSAGSGVFTALNVSAARLQELGGGFEGVFSASGQWASHALLAPQECGYGGNVFGRGFDDSEIIGDYCLLGSAELRYNLGNVHPLAAIQLYGFGDGGVVERRGRLLPFERRSDAAYSAGVGVRWMLNEHLSGWAEFAQPISRDVAQEGNRKGRIFFAVTASF